MVAKKEQSEAPETEKPGPSAGESSVSGARAVSQLVCPEFQEQLAENRKKWSPLLRNQELAYKAHPQAEDGNEKWEETSWEREGDAPIWADRHRPWRQRGPSSQSRRLEQAEEGRPEREHLRDAFHSAFKNRQHEFVGTKIRQSAGCVPRLDLALVTQACASPNLLPGCTFPMCALYCTEATPLHVSTQDVASLT